MLSWGKAVTLDAYCGLCLYMRHNAIHDCPYVGCMPHKIFVNIDIIGLNAFIE